MMDWGTKWTPEQFSRPAHVVAPALLGAYLVHETDQGTLAGRIVETEAYGGTYRHQADDGSHAFRGLTARTEPMFRPGGFSYVYLIYGMYCCMNVVTGPAGEGQAVLIRAVEPVAGVERMLENRHLDAARPIVTNGPGKLCQAMAIDRSLNGIDLGGSILYIAGPPHRCVFSVDRSVRIHIDYAAHGKRFPWRFYIRHNPYVSKP